MQGQEAAPSGPANPPSKAQTNHEVTGATIRALKAAQLRHPSSSSSSASDPTPEEIILNYMPSEEEYTARFDALSAKAQANTSPAMFLMSSQLRCYAQLNPYEKSYLANYIQCLEGKENSLAYYFIRKLYQSPTMAKEPRGLLAYAAVIMSPSITPEASIVTNATPFSRVAEDDWTYYSALAIVKASHNQPLQALLFLNLAALVPHHHPCIIAFLRASILRCLEKAKYDGARTLPNLRKNAETVIKTFKYAPHIRIDFLEAMKQLNAGLGLLELQEVNRSFQRVLSRAGHRYYMNNWQILGDPQTQPESLWSRLPESVIRHMACVVNWVRRYAGLHLELGMAQCFFVKKEYLALASTCKSYHNRMNNSAVWLHVLENKWDLDVTAFDEIIPRNPVVVVQQINELFRLNHAWWMTSPLEQPRLTVANAIQMNLSPGYADVMTRTSSQMTTEGALRLFVSVIAGDRSGKLTRKLVDNGILDYILNTIRTVGEGANVELALAAFSIMFIRSRTTCALMSRFLPPDVAKVLASTKAEDSHLHPAIVGLHTAVAASQVLYPGCSHSYEYPAMIIDSLNRVSFIAPDFEDLLKSRPGDFQPAAVEISHASMLTCGLLAGDSNDNDSENELEIDKERFNMNDVKTADSALEADQGLVDEIMRTGATIDEHIQAEIALSKIYEEYAIESDAYAELRSDYEMKLEAAEHANATLEGQASGKSKYANYHERRYAKKDDQHRALIPKIERLVPRFAAAEEEWQLFVTFKGPDTDSVLHRGILRLRLRAPAQPSQPWHVEGGGYWTIDKEESLGEISKNARSGKGRYVPSGTASNTSDASSATASTSNGDHRESQVKKEAWKEQHYFTINGILSPDEGAIRLDLEREGSDVLVLGGNGIMFGYQGGIHAHTLDEESEDPHSGIIGGFVLLKPEMVHEGALGKEDLNAFERLAHLPLKVGILSDPDHSIFPNGVEEIEELEETSRLTGVLFSVAINGSFDVVVNLELGEMGHLLADMEYVNQNTPLWHRLFFVNDLETEVYESIWRAKRLQATKTTYTALTLMRRAILDPCQHELDKDLETLMPFISETLLDYYPDDRAEAYDAKAERECFPPEGDTESWRNALAVYFKWVSRMSIFEVAGLDNLKGMRLVGKLLFGLSDS